MNGTVWRHSVGTATDVSERAGPFGDTWLARRQKLARELKHTVGTATEISERAGIGWHGRAGPGRHEEKRVVRESATVVPLSTSKRSLVLVTKSGKLGAESVKIGAVFSKRVQNPVRGVPFPIQPSSGAGFGPRNTGGMHASDCPRLRCLHP